VEDLLYVLWSLNCVIVSIKSSVNFVEVNCMSESKLKGGSQKIYNLLSVLPRTSCSL
jgi:hypothetical protein